MRKLYIIGLYLFIIYLYSAQVQTNPVIQEILHRVNIDTLYKYVSELSGQTQTVIGGVPYNISSRHYSQPGNDKASDYIKEKLESFGLQTYIQSLGASLRNVYAVQNGTIYPSQKFIICAHYDDMPDSSLAPGADDNASGTSAVLETARILSKYNSMYTIIYALWDEEEIGLRGSYYFADSVVNRGEKILGVINLDMIAYDSDNDHKVIIHTNSNSLNLSGKMLETNTNYELNMPCEVRNPGSPKSDHAAFWSKNLKAIMLIEDQNDFNVNYHTVNDKIENLNFPFYRKSTELSIATLASLISVVNKVSIELITFQAAVQENTVILSWKTTTELDNHEFEVQRGTGRNEIVWSTISFVTESAGTQTNLQYTYIDKNPITGVKSFYRLKLEAYDGQAEYSKVVEVELTPSFYKLAQNYPNPFNTSTKISWQLPNGSWQTLKVYDILGNEVATLVDEYKPAGSHEVVFDASEQKGSASGIFIYMLSTANYFSSKKMIFLK